MNSRKILSDGCQTLLKELIFRIFSEGKSIPALKFRADNYSSIQILDELESKDLLRKTGDTYEVSALSLFLVQGDLVDDLLSEIEKIYAAFRGRYKTSPGELVGIDYVVKTTGMSAERVGAFLPMMLETSLWWQGHSLHFHGETAYVTPSEGVLKYQDFKAVLEKLLEWRLSSSLFTGLHAPLISKTSLKDSEREVTSSDELESPPNTTLKTAWPAIRACLQELNFYSIKEVSGLAGLDLPAIANLVQVAQEGRPAANKGQLMSAIDGQFGEMSPKNQSRFLTIAAEEVLRRLPSSQEKLSENLSRLGWAFVDKTLTPVAIFNAEDLDELDFPRFNRHLLGSKLKGRTIHEESEIPSRIQG